MAKLVFHTKDVDQQKLENDRFLLNASKTKAERMKFAFQLMEVARLFKNAEIKIPSGQGIVLKK